MGAVMDCEAFDGVELVELQQIETEGGSVLHMLRSDSPLFRKFGEVYFSEVYSGVVKAWKRHKEMTQHFAVPVGKIRVVLFDDREDSKTKGKVCEYVLGRPDHYALLRIPPMVWYGFMSLSRGPTIIANCTDLPHAHEESVRALPDDPRFPYNWNEVRK